MPILTMLNQKGGVGKTSTCYHLAGSFAQAGKRILLIDADPQSSLTQGFLGPEATRRLDPGSTIASIFAGDEPFPAQVIRSSPFERIDFLPGSKKAARFNLPDPHEMDWMIQVSLREFLSQVQGYDLIFIDCPPNLHLCSWAALIASDAIIVPLQPEDFGAQGMFDVNESIQRVRSGPNPSLRLLGYLITMATKKAAHQAYATLIRNDHGDEVFDTMIYESIDFVEAVAARKPLT